MVIVGAVGGSVVYGGDDGIGYGGDNGVGQSGGEAIGYGGGCVECGGYGRGGELPYPPIYTNHKFLILFYYLWSYTNICIWPYT